MTNKKYNANTDTYYSNIAKKFLPEFLQKSSITWQNGIEYDCLIVLNGKSRFVEVEVKDKKYFNLDGTLKYSTLSIPMRKFKNKSQYYFMLSSCGKILFMTKMDTIKQCKTIKKFCSNSNMMEDFYDFCLNNANYVVYYKDRNIIKNITNNWKKK